MQTTCHDYISRPTHTYIHKQREHSMGLLYLFYECTSLCFQTLVERVEAREIGVCEGRTKGDRESYRWVYHRDDNRGNPQFLEASLRPVGRWTIYKCTRTINIFFNFVL